MPTEDAEHLKARCQDLLDVSKNPASDAITEYTVEFLHRTVKEFLEIKEIRELLMERSRDQFDADNYPCNALLTIVKSLPQERRYFIDQATFFTGIHNCLYHALQLELKGHPAGHRLLDKLDRVFTLLGFSPVSLSMKDEECEHVGLSNYGTKSWIVSLAA